MSFVKEYFHNIKCDRCGELCDWEMWHADPETLREIAEDQYWIEVDGKHYCPDCYEHDDDDNIVIKKDNKQ